MKRLVMAMALVAAQTVLAAGAFPISLPADEALVVEKAIASAKRAQPKAFSSVQAVRAQMGTLDAKKRGPYAAVTPRLKSIPNATWALAEALLVDGALDVGATPTAAIAWQTGLLEALGAQRDVATEGLLIAALTSAKGPAVVRSAAEGLGRLGTDRAAKALIADVASRTDAERNAVLEGMGACRRVAVADFLARQLALSATPESQLAIVKALSVLGNEWALATPVGAPVKAEVPQLRAIAAQGLVKLFSESTGNVRQQASDAILVVNAPETKLLLAQVRAKDPAAVDALLSKAR